MSRTLLLSLTALAVLVALGLSAQVQSFGESVQVTVVEVPVTVADRAGNAVRGLTKADFEVLDDGKPVPIEYFEVVDLASAAVRRPEAKLPAAATRNFLLLFDLANSSPISIGRAREAALDFVKTQISAGDVAAVASYGPKDGLRLLTNFTRDRLLLAQAIASLGVTADFHVADALMITSIFDPLAMQPDFMDMLINEPEPGETTEPGERESRPGQTGRAAATAQMFADAQDYNRMTQASYEKEQIQRIETQLANFGNVALALDRLHGQKQVILLSEGFAAHLLTGRERLGFNATKDENNAAQYGELWKVDSEKRFGSFGGIEQITEMAQLFKRADVRMHAIDIAGLRLTSGNGSAEGIRSVSNEGLALVARPTGGTVFRNSNDLAERFRNLLKQQEVIYLLGIHAPSKSPGKFHELKVKSGARAAQVTHRAGYFETSPAASSMERTLGVAEILVKDIPVRDVGVTVLASPLPGANGVARVPVVVEIAGAGLIQGLTDERGTVDLFVYAFDQDGQARDFMQQRVELDLARTSGILTGSGIRFFGALRLRPGTYSVRALVRVDETSRMGSASASIDVPSFEGGAVLAPLALDESDRWITVLSAERGAEAADLVSAGSEPMVPMARVTFSGEQEHRIALMLYRIPVENLLLSPSIVAADGTKREATLSLLGRTAPDEEELSKLVFHFHPQGLQKGSYDLRMTVTPSGGTTTVVSLPFFVQ